MIVKGEYIAVGTLHDIDIAHKKPFCNHDGRPNKLNSLCVRPHIVLKLTMAGENRVPRNLLHWPMVTVSRRTPCLRGYGIIERFIDVRGAIQAMIHDSRDAQIRCSIPVHDCERSAISKRKE